MPLPYQTLLIENQSLYAQDSKTCDEDGCTDDEGFPNQKWVEETGKRRQYTSWSNGSDRKVWRNYSYYKYLTTGGARRRTLNASYYDYSTGQPVKYTRGTLYYDNYYQVGVNVAYPYEVRDEAYAIALGSLADKLGQARTQWNMAVSMGEARETAVHIARTASRIANGFIAFKRGNIVGAYMHMAGRKSPPTKFQSSFRRLKKDGKGGFADDLGGAWMEFSYAWMPLLGDIDSAAKYLAEKSVERSYPVQEVRGGGEAERSSVSVFPSSPGTGLQYQERVEEYSHCRVVYQVRPRYLREPSTLDELGFTDPATLVWELLPLSFVVDWFVNVGQVLQSLHEFTHWKVVRGLKATRTYRRREIDLVKNWSGGINPSVEHFPPSSHLASWFDRDALGGLPTAVPLRVKVDNPFDLKTGNMASAVVLLRQAFR